MIAIVTNTNQIMINRSGIDSQAFVIVSTPSIITNSRILNWSSCAIKIRIASPLRNHNITGCGMIEVYFPNFNNPIISCIAPIITTAAKRYSSPWLATNGATTTAIAAVDELIIPGLPVSNAATIPIMIAVCKLSSGLTPATKAKAIASGISASETVIQERESETNADELLLKK